MAETESLPKIIEQFFSNITYEEWCKIPADLAENHDNYIYGSIFKPLCPVHDMDDPDTSRCNCEDE